MATNIYLANADEVLASLTMADAIQLMGSAFKALAQGRIDQPLRSVIQSPLSSGFLGLMPACVNDPEFYPGAVYGAKIGTLFPANPQLGKDPHQGCVILLSGDTGETLAILDASSVTALRTAAVTGVATACLARQNASTLALFGTGHQAEWQLRAVAEARPLTKVWVTSRNPDNVQRFVREQQANYPFELIPAQDPQQAAEQADIIVTATNSATPVLQRDWIQPGTHITAMGSSTPAYCEIDGATMAAATLFADRYTSVINESGEYKNALREQYLTADTPLTEIGAVLTGTAPGRTSESEITLFKSLGLAMEDVVVAAVLRRRYEISGQGRQTEI